MRTLAEARKAENSNAEPAAASRKLLRALVDPERRQVGCALVQAAYGGDRSVCHMFKDWATSPTGDMVMMRGTERQWRALAEKWKWER